MRTLDFFLSLKYAHKPSHRKIQGKPALTQNPAEIMGRMFEIEVKTKRKERY